MHIKVSRNQINVKLNTNKAIKIDSFCYTEKKGSGKYLLTILNASMSKNEKKMAARTSIQANRIGVSRSNTRIW